MDGFYAMRSFGSTADLYGNTPAALPPSCHGAFSFGFAKSRDAVHRGHLVMAKCLWSNPMGSELVKKVFMTSSQTRTAGAGFAFEKAAPGCAHNLCAHCAQIPHLPGVACFVRGSRPRTKPIYILFRRARRNSTRFFDSLNGAAVWLLRSLIKEVFCSGVLS